MYVRDIQEKVKSVASRKGITPVLFGTKRAGIPSGYRIFGIYDGMAGAEGEDEPEQERD